MKFKKPTRQDFEEYLICVYFGDGDYLESCIGRAYRDFNRTLSGIASLKNKDELRKKAVITIKELFKTIKRNCGLITLNLYQDFSLNSLLDSWANRT